MQEHHNTTDWKPICPLTRQRLERRAVAALSEPLRNALGSMAAGGSNPVFWITQDETVAYPELDGIPVLLKKEAVRVKSQVNPG